jgi:hypothetical protein
MMQTDYFVGKNSANSSPLPTSKQSDSSERIATMLTAARSDWSRYLHLTGDPDLRWIETFDEYYDRDHIEKIISKSDPREFSNDYVVICCEFGAVLAHVMISLQPRLEWCYEWPYWESAIFDPQNGFIIPPFHWAIKKMSEYGVDDGFAAKIEMCLKSLEEES